MASIGVLDVLGLFEGLSCLALAGILLLRGGGRPGPVVLGLNFVAFAGILLFLTMPVALGGGVPPWAELGAYVCRIALWTFLLAFAVAYPHWRLSPGKVWALVGACIPGALLLFAVALNPGMFVAPDGGPTPMLKALALGLRDTTLVASLWVFARHWFRARGDYRAQFVVVLLPYLLYGINDGVGDLVPALAQPTGRDPFLVALSALAVLTSLSVAGLAFARLAQGRGARGEEGVLVAWVAASLPLSAVQFFGSELGRSALFLHFLVDGVATFALFWGVARHHILDVDLKVRLGIRGGVLAAIALAVVVAVEQLLEQSLGQTFGAIVGALVAAAGVFLVAPVQRFAERMSDRALPRVSEMGGADSYLHYRRLAIYRGAVEGFLRDGVNDLDRASALASLRRQLDITPAEHAMIEAEARRAVVEGSAPTGASPA